MVMFTEAMRREWMAIMSREKWRKNEIVTSLYVCPTSSGDISSKTVTSIVHLPLCRFLSLTVLPSCNNNSSGAIYFDSFIELNRCTLWQTCSE